MTRIKTMFVAAVLCGGLFALPAFAGPTEGPPTDSERIEDIQKQLNELKKSVEAIQRTLQELKNNQTESNLYLKLIATVNEQLAALQKEVDALRKKDGSTR